MITTVQLKATREILQCFVSFLVEIQMGNIKQELLDCSEDDQAPLQFHAVKEEPIVEVDLQNFEHSGK